MMLKPTTRIETYLAYLNGENVAVPEPTTRIETYLAKLCGKNVTVPRPGTYDEMYLYALCGYDITLPPPVTRLQYFMAKALGMDVPAFIPITNEEVFWDGVYLEINTISGAIARFRSGSIQPIRSLLCSISPIQSLNGYDAPWPAGGGKNKFDASTVPDENAYIVASGSGVGGTASPSSSSQWRHTDYIPVTPGDVLYFGQVTATASVAGTAFYDASKNYVSGTAVTASYLNSHDNVLTVPDGVAYMRHSFNVQSQYNPDWQTTVYIVKNSDPHEWTPYSNICPITGHDGVTAYVAGENLFDATDASGSDNGVDYAVVGGNHVTMTGTANPSTSRYSFTLKNSLAVSNGDKLTFVCHGKDVRDGNLLIYLFNGATAVANKGITNSHSATFEFTGDSTITDVQFRTATGKTIDFDCHIVAYKGTATTIPVTFSDPPGTVYGGNIDMVSGVLTVDRVGLEFDGSEDEGWRWYNATHSVLVDSILTGRKGIGTTYALTGLCNMVAQSGGTINSAILRASGSSSTNLQVVEIPTNFNIADLAAWKTFLSTTPLQLVYELATPLTYQLTPQAVNTLVGQNNVWQSSGDNVSVTAAGIEGIAG